MYYVFFIKHNFTETNQHGRAQIEFVEELCDEYVNIDDTSFVCVLHFTKYVHKPLETLLFLADPQEIDLQFNALINFKHFELVPTTITCTLYVFVLMRRIENIYYSVIYYKSSS